MGSVRDSPLAKPPTASTASPSTSSPSSKSKRKRSYKRKKGSTPPSPAPPTSTRPPPISSSHSSKKSRGKKLPFPANGDPALNRSSPSGLPSALSLFSLGAPRKGLSAMTDLNLLSRHHVLSVIQACNRQTDATFLAAIDDALRVARSSILVRTLLAELKDTGLTVAAKAKWEERLSFTRKEGVHRPSDAEHSAHQQVNHPFDSAYYYHTLTFTLHPHSSTPALRPGSFSLTFASSGDFTEEEQETCVVSFFLPSHTPLSPPNAISLPPRTLNASSYHRHLLAEERPQREESLKELKEVLELVGLPSALFFGLVERAAREEMKGQEGGERVEQHVKRMRAMYRHLFEGGERPDEEEEEGEGEDEEDDDEEEDEEDDGSDLEGFVVPDDADLIMDTDADDDDYEEEEDAESEEETPKPAQKQKQKDSAQGNLGNGQAFKKGGKGDQGSSGEPLNKAGDRRGMQSPSQPPRMEGNGSAAKTSGSKAPAEAKAMETARATNKAGDHRGMNGNGSTQPSKETHKQTGHKGGNQQKGGVEEEKKGEDLPLNKAGDRRGMTQGSHEQVKGGKAKKEKDGDSGAKASAKASPDQPTASTAAATKNPPRPKKSPKEEHSGRGDSTSALSSLSEDMHDAPPSTHSAPSKADGVKKERKRKRSEESSGKAGEPSTSAAGSAKTEGGQKPKKAKKEAGADKGNHGGDQASDEALNKAGDHRGMHPHSQQALDEHRVEAGHKGGQHSGKAQEGDASTGEAGKKRKAKKGKHESSPHKESAAEQLVHAAQSHKDGETAVEESKGTATASVSAESTRAESRKKDKARKREEKKQQKHKETA